jgi:hypothetical protein
MAASVHMPLNFIAFNANGIWRQNCEPSKQLQDIYRCGCALRDTPQNPMRGPLFQNYHFYRIDRFSGKKGGTAVAVRKGIPHNYVELCRTMLHVRYIHLTKAKLIHKRQTHPLFREDIT